MSEIWPAGAVLLGFQLTALGWRLNREIRMGELRRRTWITIADYLTYLSVIILVLGVFLLPPFLDDMHRGWVSWLFGLALIIFAATPPVIAGHYELFSRKERSCKYITAQERWALASALVVIATYFSLGLVWLVLCK